MKLLHIGLSSRNGWPNAREQSATTVVRFKTVAMAAAAALIGMAAPTNASAQANRDAACTASSDIQFICGVPGPEDLVQVPGTDWIIASTFAGLKTPETFHGGLVLINPASRVHTKVVANPADAARPLYARRRRTRPGFPPTASTSGAKPMAA